MQLLRYDSISGPFMFSRFAFFFKKLPKHLLLSYKQLQVSFLHVQFVCLTFPKKRKEIDKKRYIS